MSTEKIGQLLEQLDKELRESDDLDQQTLEKLRTIGQRLDAADPDDDESLSDHAGEIATRFAASHPTAARIARDIADLLGKMGI